MADVVANAVDGTVGVDLLPLVGNRATLAVVAAGLDDGDVDVVDDVDGGKALASSCHGVTIGLTDGLVTDSGSIVVGAGFSWGRGAIGLAAVEKVLGLPPSALG